MSKRTDKRFKQIAEKLREQGSENPEALAAFIGRKKLGKEKFQRLARKSK